MVLMDRAPVQRAGDERTQDDRGGSFASENNGL